MAPALLSIRAKLEEWDETERLESFDCRIAQYIMGLISRIHGTL